MFLRNYKAPGIAIGFILIIALALQGVTPAQASGMLQAGSVYRVSPGGATSGTCGDTWATPCDLQYALSSIALADSEIWIASGTYYPDQGAGQVDDSRDSAFRLPNGVSVYGGFAGTETLRSQRNHLVNVTILSGEIGTAVETDNAYHVVMIESVFLTVRLDGVTIRGGYSDGGNDFGGGIFISDTGNNIELTDLVITNNFAGNGGGLASFLSDPKLTRVVIKNNISRQYGGGFYNQDGSPILQDVVFDNNETEQPASPGGGMHSTNSNSVLYTVEPSLTNVTFNNNRALQGGAGGLFNNQSHAILNNVTFTNNSAYVRGGAVLNEGSHVEFNNVTFSGNTAPAGTGGAIRNIYADTVPSVQMIRNSILWGDGSEEIVTDPGNTVTIYDSIVQGGCPSGGTCANVITDDPNLGSLADNGGFTQTMAIGTDSPAFDAGNSALPGSGGSACAATDQRGFSRPQNMQCDLGAYEAYLITVTAEPKSMVYGEAESTYTFQYGSLANGDTGAAIDTPPTCGVTGAHTNAGTYTISCSGGVDNVYTFYEYVNSTLTVNKATPSLSVSNSPATYNGTAQAATVSPSVPGDVSNILTGGAVSQINAGSYPVTANFVPTDTTNYESLTGASAGTFVIGKATPTLSVSNSPATYNGASQAATVSPSVPGNVSNILTGGAASRINAGSYPVTADFVPDDTANYISITNASAGTFVIEKATPSLSVSNSPATYNGAAQAATVSPSVLGDVSNILTGGAVSQINAGSYPVTANFVPTDTTNYESLTGAPAGTFVIGKATPTLSVSNSPATYNGASQAATVSPSVPGNVSNILTGGVASQINVGTYPVTADFVPDDTANYISITNTPAGTFTIDKANPILSVLNSPVTYNGLPRSATVNSSVSGEISNILVGGSASQTDAGTYEVTANFVPDDTANYNSVTGASAGNFIINKVVPILSVTNSLVEYDGLPHSATVSSLLAGTVSNVLIDGSASQTAVGSYAVTANFTPSDTVNYQTLTNALAGTFVISPDATPPDTQLNYRPAGLSGPDVSFTFSSADGTATFECQLDGSGFSACTSPRNYVGLSSGNHTFEVRGKDPNNNIDATPAVYTWTVLTSSLKFSSSAIINSASLHTLGGSSAGDIANLGYFEQVGPDDNPSTYVNFQTSEAVYLGYRSFYLPTDIQTDLISSALLQVNVNSPSAADQIWTWSIYDWNSQLWIKIGDTVGATPNQWNSLVFPLRDIRRVISSSGEVRIQLRSSNANHGLKVDYEALHLTYRPLTVKPTLPAPSTSSIRPRIALQRSFR